MRVKSGQSALRKPSFAWQAMLIVFPVALLAAVGFFFLQQDRRLALSEATERAESLAEDLASRIWKALVDTNSAAEPGSSWFKVDAEGRLVYPPEFSATPRPQPLDFSELNPEQAEQWSRTELAVQGLTQTEGATNQTSGEALHGLIGVYRQFLDSNPPERWSAIANYRLALLLARCGESAAAMEVFKKLSSMDAVGESGLPLAPLARFHRVLLLPEDPEKPEPLPPSELKAEDHEQLRSLASQSMQRVLLPGRIQVHVEDLCSKLVNEPSALTPYLLDLIVNEPRLRSATNTAAIWQTRWEHHQKLRAHYSAAAEELRSHISPSTLVSASSWETATNTRPVGLQAFWYDNSPRPKPSNIAEKISFWTQSPEHWLALLVPAESGTAWVNCRSESEAVMAAHAIISGTKGVPAYLGAQAQVAGRLLTYGSEGLHVWREIPYMTRSGGGLRREETAEPATRLQATAGIPGVDPGLFRVDVYLTNPDHLFRRQTARTFWVGALIVAAALAALVGLVVAYRAFNRQLRLSELKSNFVSSVSHELRAPIASIRLMAESLERGKVQEPGKQQEYFGFIVRECRRLSNLIGNVLDFSRIDQGRKRYEFEETDVRTLVEETVKVMEPTAEERGVRLVCVHPAVTDAADNCATMDGHAIQQALVNLIDNAIKHSPVGQTVTLGWELQGRARSPQRAERTDTHDVTGSDEDRRATASAPYPNTDRRAAASAPYPKAVTTLSLWVEDHGPGIPEDEHERIFERFYRCGSELRRETQGVGIGLSIVKHIVEAHGGRVRLRSAPGQGSRFTIELPCNAS